MRYQTSVANLAVQHFSARVSTVYFTYHISRSIGTETESLRRYGHVESRTSDQAEDHLFMFDLTRDAGGLNVCYVFNGQRDLRSLTVILGKEAH